MSEEETIKRIEETLKLTELCQRTTNAPKLSENYIWDMRTLLDLYNKEKEKNEKLEKQIGKDLDVIYLKGIYDERDKWKDKIREIVNIMDNSESEFAKLPNGVEIVLSDNCMVIEYLRELLEE